MGLPYHDASTAAVSAGYATMQEQTTAPPNKNQEALQYLHHPTPIQKFSTLPVVPCPEQLFPTSQHMNSLMAHAPATSKKRSPQIAFGDGTPPSSRPPSRSHTKRIRSKRASERPSWVGAREECMRLDPRVEEEGVVDVMWPATDVMDVGRRIGELFGDRGPERRGFTVLCFLGCTIECLAGLSHVATLLRNFNANIFGVSLTAPPPYTSSLPIIHDANRTITLSLGLLHPLGGGRQALDAIVVLDRDSRKRMILPVGWGPRPVPGQCDDESGNGVQNVVGRCVKGVEWLCSEAVDEVVEDIDMGLVGMEGVFSAL
ncbi:hypothetical protein RUND412_009714 [Rhizina undulata]